MYSYELNNSLYFVCLPNLMLGVWLQKFHTTKLIGTNFVLSKVPWCIICWLQVTLFPLLRGANIPKKVTINHNNKIMAFCCLMQTATYIRTYM